MYSEPFAVRWLASFDRGWPLEHAGDFVLQADVPLHHCCMAGQVVSISKALAYQGAVHERDSN